MSLPALMIALVALIELALGLNAYMQVLDTTRNAARFAADNNPAPGDYPDDGFGGLLSNVPSAYDTIAKCFEYSNPSPPPATLPGTQNFYRTAACEAMLNFRPIVMYDGTEPGAPGTIDTYIVVSLINTENGLIKHRFDNNEVYGSVGYAVEDSDCAGSDPSNCGAVFYCSSTNESCSRQVANSTLHSALSNDDIEAQLVSTANDTAFVIVEMFHRHPYAFPYGWAEPFIGTALNFHSYEVMPVAKAVGLEPRS